MSKQLSDQPDEPEVPKRAGKKRKPHGCAECHRREQDAGWDDLLRALIITQQHVYAEFGGMTP